MKYKCSVCHEVFDYLPDICPVCGADKKAFKKFVEEKITFEKNTDEIFVIVGGGIAALETAKAIRKRNKTATIKMVFAEDKIPYNRPALSDLLCNKMTFADIVLENYNFYKENKIILYKNKTVISLDKFKKTIVLDDKTVIEYDKLCLACGSHAFCPFQTKENSMPVKTLRSYKDAIDILKLMKDKKRIVIAGGGILGVEAAEALNKIGGNITIVERGSCIVKAQLNEKFSSMLKKALENQGVKVLLNATVKQIQKDKIVLDNNQEIPADFMIVSMGVRGNLELAKQASLDINKSIVIDDFMRTSYKNIFSAGDCAEYKGKPGGLWIISSAQGKCAGANMAGDKSQYSVVPFATAFIGVGVKFFAVGNVHLDDIKEVKKKENYTLLSFENNILKGGILWGDTSKSNALMDLLANNANKDTAIKELL